MKKKLMVDAGSMVMYAGCTHLPGIGRSTLELLKGLARLGTLPFEICLYTQRVRGNGLDIHKLPFETFNVPVPNSARWKGWITSARIREYIGYDLLHIPHNYDRVAYPQRTLLTIHDAMFFSYPEDFLGHEFARNHYPALAQKSKGIITCSEASKSDMVAYMGIAPEKITVVPWGVSQEIFFPEKDEVVKSVLTSLGIEYPYFAMVSCDIGRKNTHGVLKAFRTYRSRGNKAAQLVLVWGNPPKAYLEEFAQEIAEGAVRFVSHLDDQQLRAVYAGALATFFPSRYEGFGLPILESMACGTPVVTCKNSSLEEVGAQVACYTDPDDWDGMADWMERFISETSWREQLNAKSLQHAATFTWERTAKAYVEFYERQLYS